MLLAVQRLTVAPDHLLIDAMLLDLAQLSHPCAQTKLYYGDALSLSIAAASVIAKVHRDALMRELDHQHPQYGLASHKGYATPEHRRALREHGPCPLHRKSFAPVAAADPNAALEITLTTGDLFLDDDLDPLDALLDTTASNPQDDPMPLRLLCITAHPDDECFAFGGALALAAQRGVETSILCLTDGSAGSYRGSATTADELGQLRRAEFAASCDILGVHHHEILDYQDGQLEFETLYKLAADLVQRIRRLRPHVIITFGGDGGLNTHADHTTVSAAATAAFHWSGSPKRFPTLGDLHTPQRLYYLTANFFVEGRLRHIPAPWTLTLDVSSRPPHQDARPCKPTPRKPRSWSEPSPSSSKSTATQSATPSPPP